MFSKIQFYQRMLLLVVAWSALIAAPQAFAYKQITVGGSHSCGLKNDGSAACWGRNNYGQTIIPVGTFTQLSAGKYHTCGLKSDGSATCWGAGKTNNAIINFEDGQSIVPNGTFTQLSAGGRHIVILNHLRICQLIIHCIDDFNNGWFSIHYLGSLYLRVKE